MTSKLSPLRKVAILLHSLDEATADLVLRQMPPTERKRVQSELASLGEIDQDIQRQIVADFCRLGDSPRDSDTSGIELDDSLAKKISAGAPAFETSVDASPDTPPFRFLRETEADTLVQFLQHERPQVIALVMAHLAPDRAARVLERFESDVQGQVLHCLSHLDETDPAVLQDLEDHLHSQLQDHIRLRKCQAAGAAAVDAILATVDPRKRSVLLQKIGERDRTLADRLKTHARTSDGTSRVDAGDSKARVNDTSIDASSFDRLYHLANEDLRRLVARANSETVVMALAGADAPLVERVLKCVTPKQSRLLDRALKHLGPTRLGDVEEAQVTLGRLAMEIDSRSNNKAHTRSRHAATA
jgi:flagellar motor switch protein FliG